MKPKEHWENIYAGKSSSEVSWYKPHLDPSLSLVSKMGLSPTSRIIDVGAGTSTLVDDLLDQKFSEITILDISEKALDISKKRLGQKASQVTWIGTDITSAKLPMNHYDLWHDRAVFHFLTHSDDRAKYIETIKSSLKVGGNLILATFNLNGPLKCSGLDVVRYSPQTLSNELGKVFKLIESFDETHQTPFKTVQSFVYCWFKKVPA